MTYIFLYKSLSQKIAKPLNGCRILSIWSKLGYLFLFRIDCKDFHLWITTKKSPFGPADIWKWFQGVLFINYTVGGMNSAVQCVGRANYELSICTKCQWAVSWGGLAYVNRQKLESAVRPVWGKGRCFGGRLEADVEDGKAKWRGNLLEQPIFSDHKHQLEQTV